MYWKRNVSPGWKGNVSIRNEVVYFSALLKFVMKSQQYFSLPHRAEIRHFITLLILFSFAC